MNEDTKIIANPSMLQIGFSFAGILFGNGFAFLVYDSSSNIGENDNRNVMLLFTTFFVLFSIMSLYMLLTSKKVILSNDSLTIKYPFLFHTKNIDFDDIENVYEDKYKVESSHNFTRIEVYSGKKIIIEFYESKKVVITSLEVSNYLNLANNLKNITKSYFKISADYYNENYSKTNIRAYIWLVFIVSLTFGLIYSLIIKRFQT